MTAGEEVVGDQAEGDVVHMSFNWSHMFGCYKVDGGRQELQTGQTDSGVPLNDVYFRFAGVQTLEIYMGLLTCVSSRKNTQQLNFGLLSEQKQQLCEPLQLQLTKFSLMKSEGQTLYKHFCPPVEQLAAVLHF